MTDEGFEALIEQAPIENEVLVALLGLIAVFGFFVFRAPEERRALLLLALASYALKAILVPLYYWFLVESGTGGFAYLDGFGYHISAQEMAYEVTHGLPHTDKGWSYKDPGYNIIVTLLYVVFGSSTLIARFFNASISTFTLLYAYRIARISFDEHVARIAARFVAFLPSPIFIIIDHRKEGVIIFVATLLFYHALRIVTQQRGWVSSVPILAFWLVPSYFLRNGFVLPFLGLFLVMFLFSQRSIALGGVASVFVIGVLLVARFVFPEATGLDVQGKIEGVDRLLAAQAWEAEHSPGLLRFAKIGSPLGIWKIPISAFLLVIMPFPPLIRGGLPVYRYVFSWSQLVFLAFLPQFFLGVREVFRAGVWRRRLPLFVYAAGFLALISALASGIMRYREFVFPIVLVITAAGIRARQNRLFSLMVYAGMSLLAVLVYFNRYII